MDRRAAYLLGLDAEFWAEILLRLKGYRILARRFLARRGNRPRGKAGGTLIFVEVKARPTLDEALITLTPQKLARIGRGARAFLSRMPAMPETIRCDAILIAPGALPRHIKGIGELALD